MGRNRSRPVVASALRPPSASPRCHPGKPEPPPAGPVHPVRRRAPAWRSPRLCEQIKADEATGLNDLVDLQPWLPPPVKRRSAALPRRIWELLLGQVHLLPAKAHGSPRSEQRRDAYEAERKRGARRTLQLQIRTCAAHVGRPPAPVGVATSRYAGRTASISLRSSSPPPGEADWPAPVFERFRASPVRRAGRPQAPSGHPSEQRPARPPHSAVTHVTASLTLPDGNINAEVIFNLP